MCCSYLISLVHIALHLCSIGYSRSHDIVYSKHFSLSGISIQGRQELQSSYGNRDSSDSSE